MVFHNNNSLFCEILLSLPLRERGLKYVENMVLMEILVAPFAGAWIEITGIKEKAIADGVAPFAGAWIEM